MARCGALKTEGLRMYQEYAQPSEGLITTSPSISDEQIAPSESVSHSEVVADGDDTIPAIEWEEVRIDEFRLEKCSVTGKL